MLRVCVHNGRGAQRVERVKTVFGTQPWKGRNAFLEIWAFAMRGVGSHGRCEEEECGMIIPI